MVKHIYYWMHNKLSKPEERKNPSKGLWHNTIRQGVITLCQDKTGEFLEVGCGEGLFFSSLAKINPKLKITGIDNNPKNLSAASNRCQEQRLENVKILNADATLMPFKNGHFDTIVCVNIFFNLESIAVIENILLEISRVCKTGGRIIFDFRNALNPLVNLKYKLAPYYDSTVKNLPLMTYRPKRIENLLVKNQLKVVNKQFMGFPGNILSPIIIIEAEKC